MPCHKLHTVNWRAGVGDILSSRLQTQKLGPCSQTRSWFCVTQGKSALLSEPGLPISKVDAHFSLPPSHFSPAIHCIIGIQK